MARDYDRTTRECTTCDLRPELRDALARLADEQQLGDVQGVQLVCIETRNERLKRGGIFGSISGGSDPDKEHYTAAVITPVWLLWAMTGEKRGTTAFCTRLDAAMIRDYDLRHLIQDDGITIDAVVRRLRTLSVPTALSASAYTSAEPSSFFLGLGPGAATERFRTVLGEAIRNANTPRR